MNKINLDDFLLIEDFDTLINIDEEILNVRYNRNIYRQLMDVWGEVNNTIQLFKKWKKSKKDKDFNEFYTQLKSVHRICCIMYSNPNISDGLKWELKVAEWELYDFTLWDNSFGNNINSVTRWFDQWCYDINYDLL